MCNHLILSIKMKTLLYSFIAVLAFTLTSCNESKTAEVQTAAIASTTPTTGDIVPTDNVCMVNNAYMGKKQFEVDFEGKTYYGCCEDCKRKIPQQENARVAIDPVSGNEVDKSVAIIAIADAYDNVLYFENEENYKTYFQNLN